MKFWHLKEQIKNQPQKREKKLNRNSRLKDHHHLVDKLMQWNLNHRLEK